MSHKSDKIDGIKHSELREDYANNRGDHLSDSILDAAGFFNIDTTNENHVTGKQYGEINHDSVLLKVNNMKADGVADADREKYAVPLIRLGVSALATAILADKGEGDALDGYKTIKQDVSNTRVGQAVGAATEVVSTIMLEGADKTLKGVTGQEKVATRAVVELAYAYNKLPEGMRDVLDFASFVGAVTGGSQIVKAGTTKALQKSGKGINGPNASNNNAIAEANLNKTPYTELGRKRKAEDVNVDLIKKGFRDPVPYKPGTMVQEYTPKNYVIDDLGRAYDSEAGNISRRFSADLDEINNSSVVQIKDRYSIPNGIDSKARSNIKADTPMQKGIVNPDSKRGLSGEGVQHQIRNWDDLSPVEKKSMFKPNGSLNN